MNLNQNKAHQKANKQIKKKNKTKKCSPGKKKPTQKYTYVMKEDIAKELL